MSVLPELDHIGVNIEGLDLKSPSYQGLTLVSPSVGAHGENSLQSSITSAHLTPGDAKIKSWHDVKGA